ncbi:4Fe-4S binding protein [Thermodesulfobium sp.]|uniref:4Fe-4S dicluster domain-containing protein n=1 Tax=Thermodesulfobium narugense TaxID=184064 RepID=A0A7C5P943_9BACT
MAKGIAVVFSIDPELCEACGACVLICPTGAIFISEKEIEFSVIDPNKCQGCGVCAIVCPNGAVKEKLNEC